MANQDYKPKSTTPIKHLLGLYGETGDYLKETLSLAKRFMSISLRRRDMRHLLLGRTLALLFATSDIHEELMLTHAMQLLGGNVLKLDAGDWTARREAVLDTAHALRGAKIDCLALRVHAQADVVDFAKYGNYSVLSCATDDFRPFAAISDIFALTEHFHKIEGLNLAYFGDGNNLCNSLVLTCAGMGINITCCCPIGHEPSADVMTLAARSVKVALTHDPLIAAHDADALYAQSYPLSMEKDFASVRVLDEYFNLAHEGCVYMNPLPAHRTLEATANVTDAPYSIIAKQAAARLPIAMALLYEMTK